ncbi:hypothetical protein [uncultured Pseudacidovorax sp.]|nr:hypothetical protein [uncultured Pseudacidovorax sp.]
MTLKGKIFSGYGVIGLLFWAYFVLVDGHRAAFAFGKALVWPLTMFPALGAFMGVVVLLLIIGAIVLIYR